MARFFVSILISVAVVGAALLLGLAGATLRTGQIDPLDWLLPGVAALALLLWIEGRAGAVSIWRAALAWALVAMPVALFILLAASRAPWLTLLVLIALLALVAAGVAWTRGRRSKAFWPTLILIALALGAVRWMLLPHDLAMTRSADRPAVGVNSALPLYGRTDSAQADLVRDAAHRSPLWQVMEPRFDLRPLDRLDEESLAPLKRLLLAQPRLFAPEELVALDDWVRRGGHALILADPLLHWADPRPLGDRGRAPLTSLLDPLLIHWGLRLDPAPDHAAGDPPTRRILSNGAMLQMAGSSRFAVIGRSDAACRFEEAGLIARCKIGKGRALLVADADWVNDALWTLAPGSPHDRTAWVSDAVPVLTAWLESGAVPIDSGASWLVDENRLISALRWALLALLVLAAVRAGLVRYPMTSHGGATGRPDQIRNIGGLKADSG